MPQMFGNYDRRIRSHILIDVIEKVPIEESFENLCKEIGKDAITFYDFQFWYYRFLKTKPEFDFDRSTEPEPLQFSDLALDAVGLIVNKLELADRLMLRHVSKPLRDFIEQQDPVCDSIHISCGTDLISIAYGGVKVLYTKNDETFKKCINSYRLSSRTPNIVDDFYEPVAFNDLAWVLKNPKLQLTSFRFDYEYFDQIKSEEENKTIVRCCERIDNVLKSLKHQVAVDLCSINAASPDNLLAILPYLKPGCLKELSISAVKNGDSWGNAENSRKIEQLVNLNQWKQANDLHLNYLLEFFPDNAFIHFKLLVLCEEGHEEEDLHTGVLSRLRDIFVKSETLKFCSFDTEYGFGGEEYEIGVWGRIVDDAHFARVYMIPNSRQYVDFQFQDYGRGVYIEKKTR